MESEFSNPLVSIIIPVYKVEGYLNKCLDSIERIDYQPIEVILVDDASPDNCGQIIDEYVSTNQGWVAIHKPCNEGVASARVTGEEHASGDFIMFVDSDDYVHPSILSRLVPVALRTNADVTCCGYCIDDGKSVFKDERNADMIYNGSSLTNFINNRMLFDFRINKPGIPLFLCVKLFKNKSDILLESLKKGVGLEAGEDIVALLSYVLSSTDTLVCVSDPLYFYVKHPGQLTGMSPLDLFDKRVLCWERLDNMNDGRFSDQLAFRIFNHIKNALYHSDARKSFNFFRSFANHIRGIPVVKKYLFCNKSESIDLIRNHPHFFLVKKRLYLLDYLFSLLISSKK